MTSPTIPMARGSTVQATLDFIEQTYGVEVLAAVRERLEPGHAQLIGEVGAKAYLPYVTLQVLWRAADAVLGAGSPDWMERAGAFAIGSSGQRSYGGLLRKASPAEFVTQSVSLFRLYYTPGDIEAVEVQPERAVLRLVGFEALGGLFCRRQTGGLRKAAELAGGKDVQVRHVRCAIEGDAYCEWEMRWS
jgi:hypothetical protein